MPCRFSREDRGNNLVDTALNLSVVGDSPRDGDLTCAARAYALVDELCSVDQDTGAGTFFQPVFAQVSDLSAECCE